MNQVIKLTAVISRIYLGKRLDLALAKLFPNYSRTRIKKWILNKCVMINGNICDKPKKKY